MIRIFVALVLSLAALASAHAQGTYPGQASANEVWATPNGSSGPGSFRKFVYPDMPNSGVTASSYPWLNCPNFTVNTQGVVTNATETALQTTCVTNLLPTATRAGDVIYWNGSTWVTLAGNNSGTQFLQENSSGVPSWATVAGSGTVTNVNPGTYVTTSPSVGITTSGSVNVPLLALFVARGGGL